MDVVNELPVDSSSKIDLDLAKKDTQDDSKLDSQESIEATSTSKHSFIRIDLIYLPLGAIIYLLSFFWRSNIGNTGFDLVTPDFKLTVRQSDAAWAAFFVLFVILPVMHTIIVERFVQARYWLTFLLLMLSAVQTGMGWADSKGWIYLCRILLGVCVSGIVPIMLCICMHWYSRFQTAFRFSCIVGPAILIGALSGILAWMLNIGIDQQLGQAGWRWILLIVGLLTFAITIASAFLLPQYPSKASWLSVEGREWHISHAITDRQQLESEQSQSVKQVARSILGKRQNQLFLLLCTFVSFPLYGYYHYAGGVIARLAGGLISLRWQFTIAAAPWALAVIVYMIASWYSDKLRQRGVLIVAGLLTISLGHMLLISSKNVPANIIGCFLVASGVLSAVHLTLLWSCEEGGALARAIMCGLAYSCLQLAAFASRFMFAAKHGPDFTAGHAVCLATSLAGAALAALLSRRERASRK